MCVLVHRVEVCCHTVGAHAHIPSTHSLAHVSLFAFPGFKVYLDACVCLFAFVVLCLYYAVLCCSSC